MGLRTFYCVSYVTLLSLRDQFSRVLFLILTIAVGVCAWWGLSAMASPFVTVANPGKSHFITVSGHKGAFNQPLPKRYADRIASLPDARELFYSDIDVITCGATAFSVTINAWGGPGTPDVLLQEGYSQAQIVAFMHDPLALLTDADTARRCGWRKGMGVSPRDFAGKPVELHITAMTSHSDSPGSAIAHYDYINRVGGISRQDRVAEIYVRARDPRKNSALAAQIQSMFAHSAPPVQAVPDTVNQSAWTRFGKVQYLLAFVMAAVFSCCALVFISVMAHTTTQRRPQMALGLVLGFPRPVYWVALTLEVTAITVVGAVIGMGLGDLVVHWLQRFLGSTFQSIKAPDWAWMWLWPALCALLSATLVMPSIIVSRLRPTDCRDL
ncbi:MAG TPA: FtsX-like permease family protein [Rhodanobacteraceae bacterium]|nr:FtsX-like permease family protein [Rhodanobacteraceae bacterium]